MLIFCAKVKVLLSYLAEWRWRCCWNIRSICKGHTKVKNGIEVGNGSHTKAISTMKPLFEKLYSHIMNSERIFTCGLVLDIVDISLDFSNRKWRVRKIPCENKILHIDILESFDRNLQFPKGLATGKKTFSTFSQSHYGLGLQEWRLALGCHPMGNLGNPHSHH